MLSVLSVNKKVHWCDCTEIFLRDKLPEYLQFEPFWEEEKRIRQGKKVKTISEKSEREFRSELKTEFRRYVKDNSKSIIH